MGRFSSFLRQVPYCNRAKSLHGDSLAATRSLRRGARKLRLSGTLPKRPGASQRLGIKASNRIGHVTALASEDSGSRLTWASHWSRSVAAYALAFEDSGSRLTAGWFFLERRIVSRWTDRPIRRA